MQSQFKILEKIPRNGLWLLVQQQLFAADKVKVCFANNFSLPQTNPQLREGGKARIRDINWSQKVSLPDQLQHY